MIQNRKKRLLKKKRNLRLLKVKFINKAIPSVVYPRLMQPQMLQLLIRVLSERSVLWVNPTTLVPIGGIEEEALHLGINNTKTLS